MSDVCVRACVCVVTSVCVCVCRGRVPNFENSHVTSDFLFVPGRVVKYFVLSSKYSLSMKVDHQGAGVPAMFSMMPKNPNDPCSSQPFSLHLADARSLRPTLLQRRTFFFKDELFGKCSESIPDCDGSVTKHLAHFVRTLFALSSISNWPPLWSVKAHVQTCRFSRYVRTVAPESL